jgi:hypothetical protein
LILSDVRRAFRQQARYLHPDAEGGSTENFELLVAAYKEITAEGATFRPQWAAQTTDGTGLDIHEVSSDGFIRRNGGSNWATRGTFSKGDVRFGPWGSFDVIEMETDRDEWGGRSDLLNGFVSRHDGCCQGGVLDGDVAIYRLHHPIDGKAWGVAEVMAVQGMYESGDMKGSTNTGMDGQIYMWPLKRQQIEGATANEDVWRLIPDECAEIQEVRVVDRLEVLQPGVGITALGDRTFELKVGGFAFTRLVTSGKVHIPQCDFGEACDVQAAECAYCYEEGCDVESEL